MPNIPQSNNAQSHANDRVLVVGGGIAGMQAALDLADMGRHVMLLDRSPTIGGNMARLDKTFPTNDCSMCIISPRMLACSRHSHIEIRSMSELLELLDEVGRFHARIRQHPRHVDESLCIGCGLCVEKCPVKVPNEHNAGLDQRKAIHFVHPQAIPTTPLIDKSNCLYFRKGRCRICEKLCPVQAVRLHETVNDFTMPFTAVILAMGFEVAVLPNAGEYGHGRYSNVVTGLQFERILSSTGPYQGRLKRPSDGGVPRRIAWIQCVGSRDRARRRDFCSSVCCMAAAKQAMLVREQLPESEAVIFYMDIRAPGKDFERYVQRARERYGVRYVRSMLSQIIEHPRDKDLILNYYDTVGHQHREERFDLVVLSAGFRAATGGARLLEDLDVATNLYGFVETHLDQPVCTSRPGVFVCGAMSGPKDIPDTVAEASAAAACAAHWASGDTAREIHPTGEEAGEETDENTTDCRIGVFVCHCGKNIAGVVDIEEVKDYTRRLPGVHVVEDFLFTCSTQAQERLKELISEQRLNRVVVAACSPRTHEPLFQETLTALGLNKHLFEMANIREQCAWVHRENDRSATTKAKKIIAGAVGRAGRLQAFQDVVTAVVPEALVIGGGISGMVAALRLAGLGLSVHLVEKEEILGGAALQLRRTLQGESPQHLVRDFARQVENQQRIRIYRRSRVTRVDGGVGNFQVRLHGADLEHTQLQVGVIILATGAQPYQPEEFFYGRHPAVRTQLELEQHITAAPDTPLGIVAMIQCVGSRNTAFPSCSRLCCAAAIKNAITLLERQLARRVLIFYRDMMTFGFKEIYYRRARELGTLMFQFDPKHPPSVEPKGERMLVRHQDQVTGERLEVEADLLVLSTGVRPSQGTATMAQLMKLPVNNEGFLMEAHPKLRPLDLATDGVFVCGLAHSPRFIDESIAQAQGVAARAAHVLLYDRISTSGMVAQVNPDRCTACLVCVDVCPYQVPHIGENNVSVIDKACCKGCGICVAECPAKAIAFHHYGDDQLLAQVDALCA